MAISRVEQERLRLRVLLVIEQQQARAQPGQARGRAVGMLRGEVAQGVRGLGRAGESGVGDGVVHRHLERALAAPAAASIRARPGAASGRRRSGGGHHERDGQDEGTHHQETRTEGRRSYIGPSAPWSPPARILTSSS